MPEVSVIIPLYNGQAYIAETIDSVLGQTYKDYEIIVVDDGSTDRSPEIISRYKDKILYLRQRNKGISAARNAALSVAKGKFIAFIDHDDRWLADKLEKQIALFKKAPDLGLVYSDSYIIDEHGRRHGTLFGIDAPRKGHVFFELLKANFIPVLTAVVRRSVIDEIGPFDERFSIAEDLEFFLRILKTHKCDFIAEPLAEYRIHQGSFSRKKITMLSEVNRIIDSYMTDQVILSDRPSLNKVRAISARYKYVLAMAYLNEGDKGNARRILKDDIKRKRDILKKTFWMIVSYLPGTWIKSFISGYTNAQGLHAAADAPKKDKKIKILYVIDSTSIGGTEMQTARLMRYLDKEKFIPLVACPDKGDMLDMYRKYAKKVYTIPARTFFSIRAVRSLSSIAEKEDVDIIHSHLFTSDFCSSASAVLKRKVFISTVVGFNFLHKESGFIKFIRKSMMSFLYRIVYLPAAKLIAVADAVKQDLSSRAGIRVGPGKIDVIYCGVPEPASVNPEYIRKRYSLKNDDKVISCVANMFLVKGHTYLLQSIPRVLEKFPKVRFFLVGDGPERQRLESESKTLGIADSIIFAGYLSEDDKNAVVALSEMMVLPSLTEGCPQAVLEAMALSKPVIASNVGGVPELIVARQTGLLVKPKDPKALSDAVITLLSDESSCRLMGRNGRLRYEGMFSVEKMVRSTSDIYLEALKAPIRHFPPIGLFFLQY